MDVFCGPLAFAQDCEEILVGDRFLEAVPAARGLFYCGSVVAVFVVLLPDALFLADLAEDFLCEDFLIMLFFSCQPGLIELYLTDLESGFTHPKNLPLLQLNPPSPIPLLALFPLPGTHNNTEILDCLAPLDDNPPPHLVELE